MTNYEAWYHTLHQWMNKHYPRTGRCEYCGCTNRRTEYASASHDRYTRNRADWFEFCHPCHAAFDGSYVGSDAHRQAVSTALKGRELSPAHREALSRALKGKTKSLAHRQALSGSMKRKTKEAVNG